MTADDSLLLAIGTVLTALALVSGYFILAEVLILVREWSGAEPKSARRRRRAVAATAERSSWERIRSMGPGVRSDRGRARAGLPAAGAGSTGAPRAWIPSSSRSSSGSSASTSRSTGASP